MITELISDDIAPKMKILNMVITTLKHFCVCLPLQFCLVTN